mgnify:CR=1 FL=1
MVAVKFVTGTGIEPQAEIKIRHKKKIKQAKSSGDGPVDACYKAIDKIIKLKVKLTDYKIEAVTIGKDAQGLVRVGLESKSKRIQGRGSSTDILEASAKAYLDALNRLI